MAPRGPGFGLSAFPEDLMDFFLPQPLLAAPGFASPMTNIFDLINKQQGAMKEKLLPSVEVVEDDKSFSFSCDVPGFKKEDVSVDLSDDGVLTIAGKREAVHHETTHGKLHVSERRYGSFQRSFVLPLDTVDPRKIEGSLTDGVLSLTVPKLPEKEQKPPTKITLK